MSSRPNRDEHAIYFLVSDDSSKNWQLERYPAVNLCGACPGIDPGPTPAAKPKMGDNATARV